MIKFFRHIRRNLIAEGRITKYVKYAFGEIVLVVIGILIALQINSWNEKYRIDQKELKYLIEIRESLLIDQENAKHSINVNNQKLATIDSVMILLSKADERADYINYLAENHIILSVFPTFEPVRVAFDNMINAHSIDIIKNQKLRLNLSTYYNYNWERSPQSVSRSRTRKFADILMEKLVDNPRYHSNLEDQFESMLNKNNEFHYNDRFQLDIKDPNYLEFHNDRKAISAMYVMVPTSIYQSRWIENAGKNIAELLNLLEIEIENKN